jgi:hypothetical protein
VDDEVAVMVRDSGRGANAHSRPAASELKAIGAIRVLGKANRFPLERHDYARPRGGGKTSVAESLPGRSSEHLEFEPLTVPLRGPATDRSKAESR